MEKKSQRVSKSFCKINRPVIALKTFKKTQHLCLLVRRENHPFDLDNRLVVKTQLHAVIAFQ